MRFTRRLRKQWDEEPEPVIDLRDDPLLDELAEFERELQRHREREPNHG